MEGRETVKLSISCVNSLPQSSSPISYTCTLLKDKFHSAKARAVGWRHFNFLHKPIDSCRVKPASHAKDITKSPDLATNTAGRFTSTGGSHSLPPLAAEGLLPPGSAGLLSQPQPAEVNFRQHKFSVLASRDKLRTHKPGWGLADNLRDGVSPGDEELTGTWRATEVAVGPLFHASERRRSRQRRL